MKFKRVLPGILAVIIVIYLGISFYVAHEMTKPTARHLEISPTFIAKTYEAVSFQDREGLTLRGWYYPNNSERTIVMVSGILANRTNVGYFTPFIAKDLLASGYNVLVYDHRATGESGGKRVSYGQQESHGVLAAVNWLKTKGFSEDQLGIIGVSMGSASVLMAIDQLNNLGPIVIDSAPADIKEAASHILSTERGIPGFFHPMVYFLSKTLFKVDFASVKPIEKIALVPQREFLFLHATKDISVLPENSQRLKQAANPNSKVVLFEGGAHLETYKTNPDLYRQEILDFLNSHFK